MRQRTMSLLKSGIVAWTFAVVALTPLAFGEDLGTGLAYQGQLKRAGVPVNDSACSLRFSLWDGLDGGAPIGSPQTVSPVNISNGLFTVEQLNGGGEFGPDAFNGEARWLKVEVMCTGDADFSPLSPRQPLTATPYALQTRGMFVDETGQVGIGTNTPNAELEVAASGDDTYGFSIDVAGGSDVSDCCTAHESPGCDDAVCEAIVCSLPYEIYPQAGVCCTHVWRLPCVLLAQEFCGALVPGDVLLTARGGTERITLGTASEGRVLTIDNNMVGIQTDAPQQTLDVNGGVKALTVSASAVFAGVVNATGSGIRFPDGTLQGTAAAGSTGDGYSLDAVDGDPADAVYVDVEGNVGIGKPNPGQKLDVAGSIQSSGPSGGRLIVSNPNNQTASASLDWLNDVARIRISGNPPGSDNGFDIQGPGNVSLLRILDNGNVGIGTTTPHSCVRRLEVHQDSPGSARRVQVLFPPLSAPTRPCCTWVGLGMTARHTITGAAG